MRQEHNNAIRVPTATKMFDNLLNEQSQTVGFRTHE
jgi:hypothetical protein